MNEYTPQEMLSFLDEDISRIPNNQRLKLKMLEKQNTSPERMELFIKEMKESERALHSKRIFLFIDYYLKRTLS